MLGFKQFITENQKNIVSARFDLPFDDSTFRRTYQSDEKKVHSALVELTGIKDLRTRYLDGFDTVFIYVNLPNHTSQDDMWKLQDELSGKLRENWGTINNRWMIIRDTLPEDADVCDISIMLDYHFARNVSLIGIHKHIRTTSIMLQNAINVSQGGLGLLKVPEMRQLNIGGSPSADNNPNWLEIIIKAFKENNRKPSILDTQDELIKNGLKAYARI